MKVTINSPLLFALLLAACSDTPNGTDDPDVSAPSNLRAASADSAVLLQWTTSRSEGQANFGGYVFYARNKTTGEISQLEVPAGASTARMTGLQNGIRYSIVARSKTLQGKQSRDSSTVEWSPARRIQKDESGGPIRIYATTSTLAEGVNIYGDSGTAEMLELSSQAFNRRGMLYVYSANFAAPLELTSAHLWALNPGDVTEFSNVSPISADNLEAGASTSSPAAATYTLSALTLDNQSSTRGRIYFGRVNRVGGRHYFRLLIKKSDDGYLVHGAGPDRYLEVEASYQSTPNVPYSK